MSGRRRVIHVTTADVSLELLLGPQLRAFRDAGYEVIGASAPGPLAERLVRDGIRHVPLRHATRSFSVWRDARAFAELHRVFRRLEPDIVHTHNPKPGVYGRLAARTARVPAIVNTQHGLYATPEDRWGRRAAVYGLERIAARCSHAELVQNSEDLETLARLGVPRSKLHLLGNGIDLDRFSPDAVSDAERERRRAAWGIEDGDVVVGMVGRLVGEKGFREAFDAARILRRRGVRARWVVAGPLDPDKGDALDATEVEAAVRDGITVLGMRDDMPELYASFDVFALASHREGFPRSAMEAAAMGLPTVATDIRGCRQVVDDGVTGVLVSTRDPAALGAAVERLARDRALRDRMGERARGKARRDFDQKRVIELTLSVYERLLGGRAPLAVR